MDHSSLIYLMDPLGQFITTFDEEVNPGNIVKALKEHWAAKPVSLRPKRSL
jgi:cytochrome oxidase Cu insertion factor (SCO1/SenC/PrrC family)